MVTVSSHWKSRTPLDWENFVVLQTNQALIGLVAPHLLAVSVKATDDEAVLYFAFERDDFDNQEDADDICAELDVFLEGKVQITAEVHVGPDDESWEGSSHRRVYRAKR